MLWRRGCRRRIRTAIDRFKVCRPTCLDDPAIGWVDSTGIAPATCALGVRCSGLLSYESESTSGRNCTHMTTFEASHPESVR